MHDIKPDIKVYCTEICPYCIRAMRLLDSKGVKYTKILIDKISGARKEMEQKSGCTSVPQIFIDAFHVGGFDDLYGLDIDDKLDPMLKEPLIVS